MTTLLPAFQSLLETHAQLPIIRRLNEVVDTACRAYDLAAREELSPLLVTLVTVLALMLVVTGRQRRLLGLIRREEARRAATAARPADPGANTAAPETNPPQARTALGSAPASAARPPHEPAFQPSQGPQGSGPPPQAHPPFQASQFFKSPFNARFQRAHFVSISE